MQLYNSLSHKKEIFTPATPGVVNMYVCGVTVYDYCHIGHARSAVFFNVLANLLRQRGYKVNFIRNFTDIDDKIINRANIEGRDWQEVASTYIDAFYEDMAALSLERADWEPRATDHIAEIRQLCQQLIDKGHAYATTAGDVYFRVRSFPAYGKLSGRTLDDLLANTRDTLGEDKEDPLDFALWKAAKPGEPSWESPWGPGRPGWHIECSAMSEKYLPLDIHGGGLDLIFPHHENEIAQSEAACGVPLARYWVHNGFVQVNHEKMSKSLGNFKTIRDILREYQPETLRFFLLSKHYRSPIDFSEDSMIEAEKALQRIYDCLAAAATALSREKWKQTPLPEADDREFAALCAAFDAALDDDCNTAEALGHLFGLVRLCNRVLEDKALRGGIGARDMLTQLLDHVRVWHGILGLFGERPQDFLAELRTRRASRHGLDVAHIEALMQERQAARAARDFARSDTLRDELAGMGVVLRDTPTGAVWDIAQK